MPYFLSTVGYVLHGTSTAGCLLVVSK